MGSTAFEVKPWVNKYSLVGGELKEPKRGVVEPLRWSETTTKVVVVELSCCSRVFGCPAVIFGAVWGLREKSQK